MYIYIYIFTVSIFSHSSIYKFLHIVQSHISGRNSLRLPSCGFATGAERGGTRVKGCLEWTFLDSYIYIYTFHQDMSKDFFQVFVSMLFKEVNIYIYIEIFEWRYIHIYIVCSVTHANLYRNIKIYICIYKLKAHTYTAYIFALVSGLLGMLAGEMTVLLHSTGKSKNQRVRLTRGVVVHDGVDIATRTLYRHR